MTPWKRWENQLCRWHDEYRRDSIAWVVKTTPPVVIGPGGKPVAWEGEGPPDFVGVVAGGRAVAFDAKHVATRRFPLRNVEVHQARDLEAVADRGGIAFLAIESKGGRYVVRWTTIREAYWSGVPSVVPAEVGTEIGPNGWLGVVR